MSVINQMLKDLNGRNRPATEHTIHHGKFNGSQLIRKFKLNNEHKTWLLGTVITFLFLEFVLLGIHFAEKIHLSKIGPINFSLPHRTIASVVRTQAMPSILT